MYIPAASHMLIVKDIISQTVHNIRFHITKICTVHNVQYMIYNVSVLMNYKIIK